MPERIQFRFCHPARVLADQRLQPLHHRRFEVSMKVGARIAVVEQSGASHVHSINKLSNTSGSGFPVSVGGNVVPLTSVIRTAGSIGSTPNELKRHLVY